MAALDVQPRPAEAEVTVLVVDDERAVRNVVHRTLRLHRYAVLEAADAAWALMRLGTAAGGIHLVLTDDRMPGMSGRELAAIGARVYPSVRVVLMSGNPAPAGDADSNGLILPKPFAPQTLGAMVQRALSDPSPPRSGGGDQ